MSAGTQGDTTAAAPDTTVPALLVMHADLAEALLHAASAVRPDRGIEGAVELRAARGAPEARIVEQVTHRRRGARADRLLGWLLPHLRPQGDARPRRDPAHRREPPVLLDYLTTATGSPAFPSFAERLQTKGREHPRPAPSNHELGAPPAGRPAHPRTGARRGASGFSPATHRDRGRRRRREGVERQLYQDAAPGSRSAWLMPSRGTPPRPPRTRSVPAAARPAENPRCAVEAGAATGDPAFNVGGLHHAPGKDKVAEYVFIPDDADAPLRGRCTHAISGARRAGRRPRAAPVARTSSIDLLA